MTQPSTASALSRHISSLEAAGALSRHPEEVSVHELGGAIAAEPRAVVFDRVRGYDVGVAANLLATRGCWAAALDVEDAEVRAEITRRLGRRIAPVVVEASGLHDVVQLGEEVDLTELPVYLQHAEDGGPYISAAMDVTRSTVSGEVNLGIRRLMMRSRQETSVDVVAPSDLRAYYSEARDAGKRFEVAFVIGGHPMDVLASQLKMGAVDDWELAGSLRAEAVPLIKCQSIDQYVPADAEIVIEGYFEGDWSEIEGPYGEYHGCLGPPHRNPVYRVTGVTRRADALFQSMTIGNPSLGHTDTAMIAALKLELMVWSALERSVARPRDVFCPPAAGGRHHVRIQIDHRDPGDPRNALYAALSCQADVKMAVVVDEDINIRSDEEVEWAISTRFQADADAIVMEGLRTLPLEPSLDRSRAGGITTSKLGIDATRGKRRPPEAFRATTVVDSTALPESTLAALPGQDGELPNRILDALDQPRTFLELVVLLAGVHQRDLITALGELRNGGKVAADDAGRYCREGSE